MRRFYNLSRGLPSLFSYTSTLPRSIAARKPFINVMEVGPRDGLQNESRVLSVDTKHEFLQRLDGCGFRRIEAGSLVHPTKVPQMAGTTELLNRCFDIDAYLSVLVPTRKHFERLPNNVDEIVLFVAASDTFNQRNIGTDVNGAFKRFEQIFEAIHTKKWPGKVRASISCVWGCPYEGKVNEMQVCDIIQRFDELGVDSVDICDTIGIATPKTTGRLLSHILGRSMTKMSLHMHDTNGLGVENCMVGVDMGIRDLQSSIGGIGGCPFSPKRAGNVDTSALLARLHAEGFFTGVNEYYVYETARWIKTMLAKK